MLKILQGRLQQYMNWELSDVQAVFRKDRETKDKIANTRWIMKKARQFQKNIDFSFIDYAKGFDCVDHNKLRKILKRWEYQTILPVFWEICMQVQKQQIEPCVEQLIGSRLRKEYYRAVCCRLVCLTYMLSTSWEMPSRNQDRQEKYQQPQICRWYHYNGRKWRGTKEPHDEGEDGEWKSQLRTKF